MTNAEKAKLNKTAETVDRIMTTQNKIDRVLKEIRIDAIRNRIEKVEKQFDNYALKHDTQSQINELAQGVMNATSTLSALTSDHSKNKNRVESRHDSIQKTTLANSEAISKLQIQCETLAKHVSRAAKQSSTSVIDSAQAGKKSKKNNDDDDAPTMKELQDIINSEVNDIHEELKEV